MSTVLYLVYLDVVSLMEFKLLDVQAIPRKVVIMLLLTIGAMVKLLRISRTISVAVLLLLLIDQRAETALLKTSKDSIISTAKKHVTRMTVTLEFCKNESNVIPVRPLSTPKDRLLESVTETVCTTRDNRCLRTVQMSPMSVWTSC